MTAKSTSKKNTGKGSAAKRGASSARKTSGKRSARSQKKKSGLSAQIRLEIILVLTFSAALILFLSLFGKIGPLGEKLAAFQTGRFGKLAYFLPFYLFGAVIFLILRFKKYPLNTLFKLLASFATLTVVCGLAGDKGGSLGAFWNDRLKPVLGKTGTLILLIALLLIFLAITLGRAILAPLGLRGKEMAGAVKDEGKRYRDEMEEKRRKAELRHEERMLKRVQAREAAAQEAKARTELIKSEDEQIRITREQRLSLEKQRAERLALEKSKQEADRKEAERSAQKAREDAARKAAEQAAADKAAADQAKAAGSKAAAAPSENTAETAIHWGNIPKTDSEQAAAAAASIAGTPLDELFREMDESRIKKETRTNRELSELDTPKPPKKQLVTDDIVLSGNIGNTTASVKNRSNLADTTLPGYGKLKGNINYSGRTPEERDINAGSREAGEDTQLSLTSLNEQAAEQSFAASEAVWTDPWKKDPELIRTDEKPSVSSAQNEAEPVIEEGQEASPEAALRQLNEAVKISGNAAAGTAAGSSQTRTAAAVSRRTAGTSSGNKGIAPLSEEDMAVAQTRFDPSKVTEPVKHVYELPPTDLLQKARITGVMKEETLRATAKKLEKTFADFGINVSVTDVSCGPSVTRYELKPEQGVKVSRIVALADDIKMSLAATDIRIEAPIPGKSAVGIEVPNTESQTVFMRTLVESEEFKKSSSKISFTVGQDIGGKIIMADLAKMPHLLIAGATGSGKSVCINSIVMSILYKAKPDEVQMIMIDPKVVELKVYNGIPHLLIPVVTDPKQAAEALNSAVKEMTRRYKLFADLNVRNLKEYNSKIKENPEEYSDRFPMPQIVVIVDEFADLMMTAASDVEAAVCRLAQLARAAGIHLVLATQRPSVNVITGLIKANIQSRIAFAVSSGVDSRTILDMVGAEKLLGKGDMLFYPSGYPKPVRIQGVFTTDEEVEKVADFWKKQNIISDKERVEETVNWLNGTERDESERIDDRDELFLKAAEYIITSEKASVGNLQRVFRIGFNRAARLMDQLADAGIVSPENGTKARQIMLDQTQFVDWKKENGYE